MSPVLKNGGDIIGDSSRVHAAAGESAERPSAVTFAALTGFSDALGTGVATEYLSERQSRPGTSGWSTHAITPAQSALSLTGAGGALEPAYQGDLAANLTAGVLQTWSPLTSDPNVAQVENLYARTDLRTPGVGVYTLLTSCSLCASTSTPLAPLNSTTKKSRFVGASTDFSHVIFESPQNLTTDASGSNFKLYESVDGVVRMFTGPGNVGCGSGAAPCSSAGLGASVALTPHTLSADGSRVIFTSPVSGSQDTLKNGTGNNASKVYEFDDHGTLDPSDDTIVQVNASERTDCAGDPTCGGDGVPDPSPDVARPAAFGDASTDGSRIFFTSSEQLTDDTPADGQSHVFMWNATSDAQGHHLALLDVDSNPGDGGDLVHGVIGASTDGHFVYFVADGQLIGNPALPLGQDSVYLWRDDRGAPELQFVGYLAAHDDTYIVNPNWNILPKVARVTPDGRHLLFESSDGSGLTGYDHGVCPVDSRGIGNSNGSGNGKCSEAYVYSADTQSLVCASCNPSGAPATRNVFITNSAGYKTGSGVASTTSHLSHAISDDGRHVFFSTAEALVPEDVNGKVDAYEYDVPNSTLHLLSSGNDSADSWFMDASADGTDAFFITRERLVGWDGDNSYDLYDARVGGGFPEPEPATQGCSGEGCQGQVSTPPSTLAPGSLSLFSAGNVGSVAASKRKTSCRPGFVRRRIRGKVRCIRRPMRRTHHAARASGNRKGR